MQRKKVAATSTMFHTFIIPFFSCIMTECRNAVEVSQGSREAFSTGSQPQKPPQPSTAYAHDMPSTIPQLERPGHQAPAAGGREPVVAGPARDQRAHSERERHHEPDIARIEERRVDHHRRVLQQRIQPLPVADVDDPVPLHQHGKRAEHESSSSRKNASVAISTEIT